MVRMRIPWRIVERRDYVGRLAEQQRVPRSLRGERVVVDCEPLGATSSSFADELVRLVLEERGAEELVLTDAPRHFVTDVTFFATMRGFGDRVRVADAADVAS